MRVTLNGKQLAFSELESGKISEKNYSASEFRILEILNKWQRKEDFELKTSGSTGEPKLIRLPYNVLKYSAEVTLRKLDPKGGFKNTLICINPFYIGGTMAVIRAAQARLDVDFVDPSSNPFSVSTSQTYDLVSMVPLQVQHVLEQKPGQFERIKHILIGGGTLADYHIASLQNMPCEFWHSYGMTETASHIALKNLKKSNSFETLGDVEIATDTNRRLKIKGTVTQNNWIQTNDIVDIIDPNKFNWLGRHDHVINTGGVKIHPEMVEQKMKKAIDLPFFVAGVDDSRFGQKLVLLVESEHPLELNFEDLDRYERPKEIYFIDKFVLTPTNKIDRKNTLNKIK